MSVLANIVIVDGLQYPTVASAIGALTTLFPGKSGGVVLIPPGTWAGPTSVPSGTALIGMSASLGLDVTPPLNQVILTYSQSLRLTNVSNVRMENLTLDFSTCGAGGGGLILEATANPSFCVQNQFTNIVIKNGGGSSTNALTLQATAAAGANNSFNYFDHCIIYANTQTTGSNLGPAVSGICLVGAGTPNTGSAATQNYFADCFVRGGLLTGIRLETNTDTNHFSRVSVLQEWASAPANSSALSFNLNTPASDQDADSCYFYGFNVTGSFASFIRMGTATGHVIDMEGYNSQPTVIVVGGSNSQFCGRLTQLNTGYSYNYNFLNGTYSIIGTPITTLKAGTGNGTNYTTSSVSFTAVDSVNLSYTATIPKGYKLLMWASGSATIATGSVQGIVNLTDTSTSTILATMDIVPALNTTIAFAVNGVLTGDGNSHTIQMQFKTVNTSDAFSILNNVSGPPTILFLLTPSL